MYLIGLSEQYLGTINCVKKLFEAGKEVDVQDIKTFLQKEIRNKTQCERGMVYDTLYTVANHFTQTLTEQELQPSVLGKVWGSESGCNASLILLFQCVS